MQKIIVGVDVGLTGAIAAIDENGEFVAVHDMPVKEFGGKGRKQVDAKAVNSIFRGLLSEGNIVVCGIEFVAARPQQSGMFSFGDSFGVVRTCAEIAGLPVDFITPKRWKNALDMYGTDKNYALTYARSLFPSAPLTLKKHDGRADALLIAQSFCLTN